ncbi:TetR family transcriptional regulator [Mycobacterium sp. M26]|uniref:TetR/AcrR family transcriptional regulator n=1 Tax=Mycobacterium sp. M26 TaxID=1762962 RepID=UPI000ACCD7C0|nr:TetR family transcriptional regulator [Mycobacterium sp. M26]
MRRPGRPPGNSDTRERILANAREMFARNGIDKTSIRAIAAAAGVDSALVHHYFGTKQQLFAAAIRMPIDPTVIIDRMRQTPVEELGHTLPAMLVALWDSEMGAALVATMRSILGGADVSLIRTFIEDIITAEIAPRVDSPPGTGQLRVQFVASQMLGVAIARYIVGVEPFASLPPDQIAEVLGPTLQRYLTGDLPL